MIAWSYASATPILELLSKLISFLSINTFTVWSNSSTNFFLIFSPGPSGSKNKIIFLVLDNSLIKLMVSGFKLRPLVSTVSMLNYLDNLAVSVFPSTITTPSMVGLLFFI